MSKGEFVPSSTSSTFHCIYHYSLDMVLPCSLYCPVFHIYQERTRMGDLGKNM